MHWSGAYKTLQERVLCEVNERLSSRNGAEDADKEYVGLKASSYSRHRTDQTQLDCIQWTINAYRRSNAMVISGVLGRIKGFLFAGNHQIAPVGAHSDQIIRGLTNKTYPLACCVFTIQTVQTP